MEFANEISIPMSFSLDRETLPTLQDVVDSLQGFDAIVKRFPKILPDLIGVPIKSVSVDVKDVRVGSLYDDLIVKFVFGGQEHMDLFLEQMHEKFMNHKAIPYLVFFALLVAGGICAYRALSPGETVSNVINSNNTTIINMISANVGKDPDAVKEIIERAVPHSDSIKLAKDSYKIFNAFGDSKSLKFGEFQDYKLSEDVVKSFPESSKMKSVEEVREFKNVEVQIRAADMDSVKTGWAAKIPSVLDRRIKVKVDGFVDVSKIRMGANVRADVTVVYKSDGEQSKPSYAIIQKLY